MRETPEPSEAMEYYDKATTVKGSIDAAVVNALHLAITKIRAAGGWSPSWDASYLKPARAME